MIKQTQSHENEPTHNEQNSDTIKRNDYYHTIGIPLIKNF